MQYLLGYTFSKILYTHLEISFNGGQSATLPPTLSYADQTLPFISSLACGEAGSDVHGGLAGSANG